MSDASESLDCCGTGVGPDQGTGMGDEESEPRAKRSQRHSVRKPRTKGLVKKIQEQIEFYFGDANLSKDRFLHQKTQENKAGYVSVDVIASFKKMQALTTERTLILKAIKNSNLVELSHDSTSMRRCHPLPAVSQAEVDLRTVYVENFPSSIKNHETISKMFREFGEISYISLPRFYSGAIKGFAFIEFVSHESSKKAVEYFKEKDAFPPDMKKHKPSKDLDARSAKEGAERAEEDMDTGDDGDGGPFENDSGDEVNVGGAVEVNGSGDERVAEVSSVAVVKCAGVKNVENGGIRAEEDLVFSSDGVGGSGEQVKDDMEGVNRVCGGITSEGGGVCDAGVSSEGLISAQEQCENEGSGRKRRRGERDDGAEADGEDVSLLSAAKHFKHADENEEEKVWTSGDGAGMEAVAGGLDANKAVGGGVGEMKSVDGDHGGKKKRHRVHRKKQSAQAFKDMDLRVITKLEWSKMKDVFKTLQKSHMRQLKADKKNMPTRNSVGVGGIGVPPTRKEFVKDCLVRVELKKKWEESDRELLKEFCEQYGCLAFLDMKDGETQGYIRYKTSGCVVALIQSEKKPDGMSLYAMEEEDERAYFLKSQAERKQRFKFSKKKLNQRGRDRLVNRALKNVGSSMISSTVDGTRYSSHHHSSHHHGFPSSSACTASTDITTTIAVQPTHIKFSDSDHSDVDS